MLPANNTFHNTGYRPASPQTPVPSQATLHHFHLKLLWSPYPMVAGKGERPLGHDIEVSMPDQLFRVLPMSYLRVQGPKISSYLLLAWNFKSRAATCTVACAWLTTRTF